MSVKINPILPKHQPITNHKPKITPKVADKTKQTNQAIRNLAVRFNGNDEPKPLKTGEPRNFETVGGDWRKDEKGKVQFYRTGEDTGKTTRFDEQFYQTVDDSFVKLNANGRLKDLPENKDKNRPENVSQFDWKGWEKVSADKVPANYSTVGKTVAFADVEKVKDEMNVFKRYVADNKLLDDNLWDEAKVQTAFNNFKSKGGKIEVEANGQTVAGKTQFNVKMDEKSLSLMRTEVTNLKAEQRKDVKVAEAGKNEVNQTFLDQGKIVYNSIVNNVEGAINTGIDLIRFDNGRNPAAMVDPLRPRVNLSGIKADYQSEMMRRDINGKLDGKGLKRGDFTEGAVTILGPLVVGKVTTPIKAPQTLEKVGAFPNLVVKEGKWNYFFDRGIKPDPHNVPRAIQNKKELGKLGIFDNSEGRTKMFDLFDQGMRAPAAKEASFSRFGTTVTKQVRVSEAGRIDIKYFYPNGTMNARPQITSIVPIIFKIGGKK